MIDTRILDRYDEIVCAFHATWPIERQEGDETHPSHLRWMLRELRTLEPADKANRWLGFVQGVLIAQGATTVAVEREVTRPILTGAE